MSTDEPFDDDLRARLGQTDEAPSDATARLDELRPRFVAARRRRQQRVAALSSAAAVVLVLVGVAVLGGGDDQSVDLADDTGPSTTITAGPSTTVAPVATSAPTTTVIAGPGVTVPTSTTTAPSGGGRPGATTIPQGAGSTAPVQTTVPVGGTQVARSEGGTATIVWTATSATVQSTAPAAGWVHEATEQKSPTRVEVRFRRTDGGSGSSTAKIDARVVDGMLTVDN